MNEKSIVFSIVTQRIGAELRCKSSLVDPCDSAVTVFASTLGFEMRRLTEKYNARDIAVLFEFVA